MTLPLLISLLFLQLAVSKAQFNFGDSADEIGIAVEALIAIAIVLLCCLCSAVVLIMVYFCGGCRGQKESDVIPYQHSPDGTETFLTPTFAVSTVNPKMNIQKEKKLLTSSANARTVSPDMLPNDIPANQKTSNKHSDDISELDKLEKASSLKRNAPEAITKVAIPKTRREKGLSFGRLDKTAQERVRSVKLLAAQGGLVPIMPVYNEESSDVTSSLTNNSRGRKNLYSTQYQEPPVPTEAPVDAPTKKDPEAIRRKVERIAKGAGGGVYNTGSSTARLSMDIVKGFDLMREKKKMEAEQAEKKRLEKLANKQQNQTPTQSVPQPAPRKVEEKPKLPEGKAKLMQFMDELDDEDF